MKNFKRQRQAVGLTQHALERITGIPRWKIVFAETGRMKLTAEELQKIKEVIVKRATEIAAELGTT